MYKRLRRRSTLLRTDKSFRCIIMNIYKIPNSEIQFIVNDHLFWEMLLMEIRVKTTAYASNKQKESRRVEEELFLNTKAVEENLNQTNKQEYEKNEMKLEG